MWEEDILPFVMTWMDLECIIQSEISQAERQGLCDIYLYVESKKAQVKKKKKLSNGNSLVVWWSGFCAFTAVTQVQSLVRELASWKPRGQKKYISKNSNSLSQLVIP